MSKPLIAYLRISTAKSGGVESLGIEAQRAAVQRYAVANDAPILSEYVEVETARKDSLKNRPQLRAAIAHAKRSGARLVIAKLDRLARSVYVTAELMKNRIDFVACDNPNATPLTIHILAAVNEDESRRISERTKAAMAAAKARGAKFGQHVTVTPELQAKATRAAAEAHKRAASEAYEDLIPLIASRATTGTTLRDIAAHLNDRGHTTRRGKPWTHVQVARVLARA